MANTFTQIHIQVVFAVKNRQSLISKFWEDELYRFITGVIQNHGHKVLQINGMPDHVHILFGMRPSQSLSDLMQHIKQYSSRWINDKGLTKGKFSWQSGYGAFSYSKSDLPSVAAYIENQEIHHSTRSFLDEYVELLEGFEYDEMYLFKEIK